MTEASIQLVTRALVEQTIAAAEQSSRQRSNHNFHPNAEANPHRFLNAFVRGTYCAPHRHALPPKAESFIVLSGTLVVFIFDDGGRVLQRHELSPEGTLGIDLAPGIWHTLAPLTPTAVCFEVKPGPYEASTDKEFAQFAPLEGAPGAAEYLQRLLSAPRP
jgi:cupin fold WbuC family metalloprotein